MASARRPPTIPADACSRLWDPLGMPVWGTAAQARFWVAVEQVGPWGHTAFTESRMDPDVGRTLEQACAYAGGRALLIRSVGDHRRPPELRRVFVAGGMPHGQPWLVTAEVEDLADVLGLPWDAVRFGDLRGLLAAQPGWEVCLTPQLLVCTNAKRDACCATRGRPLAADAAALRPGQVWECTHTGGHRFAPTGVLLPTGQTLGRLTPELAAAALDAAAQGALEPATLSHGVNRGLSHLPLAVQACEAVIRERTGLIGLSDVRAVPLGEVPKHGPADVEVSTVDGRHWRLRATEVPAGVQVKASCASAAIGATYWDVTELT